MPSSETIELIKVKSTVGLTTDLPISSTRSTLISKLKALMLKLTGTSNITNVYGTAQSAISLAIPFLPGPMATDGTFLYVCANQAAPAKVLKIDLETFSQITTLDLSGSVSNLYACVIVQRNLYIVTNTSPAKVVKINLDTFNEFTVASILPLSQNQGTAIISDGTDLYIGISSTPTNIIRVNIETFTETATVDTLNGDATYSLQMDDVFLYVIQSQNPTKVTRVKLSSFAVDSTLTIAGLAFGVDSCIYGTYLYVSSFSGKLSKINLNTFSLVSNLTTSINYANGSLLGIDGTYLIVVGTQSTATASVTYIELATFSEYGIFVLPASNNFQHVLIDGTFIYAGLSNNTIFRKYIQPTTPVDSRVLDQINRNALTQSSILSDATPFAGADIATIKNRVTGTIVSGSDTHLNNMNEQGHINLAAANQDIDLDLYMANSSDVLTQTTTIREYFHNHTPPFDVQQISQKVWPTDFDANTFVISISRKQLNSDYLLSLQSSVAEGSDKEIVWLLRTTPRG